MKSFLCDLCQRSFEGRTFLKLREAEVDGRLGAVPVS